MKYLIMIVPLVLGMLFARFSIGLAENKKEDTKASKEPDVMVTLVDQLQRENQQLKLDLAKTRMTMQLDSRICGAQLQASREFIANLNFNIGDGKGGK